MSLTTTPKPGPSELTESYYRFGDIVSAAEIFRNKHLNLDAYRGKLGRIILSRHIVSVVRDRALMHGFHDNNVIAGALILLRLPHAESEVGNFSPKVHPDLFGAFKGARANRKSQGEEYAARLLVNAVDTLTPDARDDNERRQVGYELLHAAGLSTDYVELLTVTERLSVFDTPELSTHGWQSSPYGSIDFHRTRA